jgi:hypothetical protein
VTEAETALKSPGDGVTDRQIHFLLSRAYARPGRSDEAALHRRQIETLPARMIRQAICYFGYFYFGYFFSIRCAARSTFFLFFS